MEHRTRPRRTLLTVWAHPDDEAYLAAGLMAAARRAGHRVVSVTATAGERGTDDPVGWPPERLAPVRQAELRAGLAALGVHEHHVLGFPDGGCDAVDGAGAVQAIVREIAPDTIVTFGPDGMTGHADHRAVSRWTTAAWAATGRSAELWYATLTPDFHRRWGELNDATGIWAYTDEPPCTPASDLSHLVRLEGAALDQKLAALRAHRSQTGALESLVGAETFREWWREEAFVRAAGERGGTVAASRSTVEV